jgi:GNAT superfamily N-acetyltransferase
VSPLRNSLAAHLGQVLTPEVAAAIELATVAPTENGHNPEFFGSVSHGGYTIAVERFSDIVLEMHALHELHWQETETWRHGLAMNPNYLEFVARERRGQLIQFTVRSPIGLLVGNLRMYLAESLHTQTRYASEDTLFIHPDHRGGFLAMALIRFAERSLHAIGIQEIRVNSKLVNKADVLMRRMKYQPVAIQFVKFSGGKNV